MAAALKAWYYADDFELAFLSNSLIERKLFRLEWHNQPVPEPYVQQIRSRVAVLYGDKTEAEKLVYVGKESIRAYDEAKDRIMILFKDGHTKPIDQCSDVPTSTQIITKYFICYPKLADPNRSETH